MCLVVVWVRYGWCGLGSVSIGHVLVAEKANFKIGVVFSVFTFVRGFEVGGMDLGVTGHNICHCRNDVVERVTRFHVGGSLYRSYKQGSWFGAEVGGQGFPFWLRPR